MNERQTGARRQREAHRRHTVAQREPEGQRGEPMAGGRMGQTTKHKHEFKHQHKQALRPGGSHVTTKQANIKKTSTPEAVDILHFDLKPKLRTR